LSANQTCSSSVQCDSELGLTCSNGVCNCSTNYVWNGYTCSKHSLYLISYLRKF